MVEIDFNIALLIGAAPHLDEMGRSGANKARVCVQCLQIDLFLAVFLPSSYKTFLMNQSSFDKDRQHSSRSRRDIIFPQNHIKSRKEMKNPHPQTRTQEKFARKVCKLSNNKKNVEIFLFFSSSLFFEPVHED